ncbi:MAG: hypothetical protein ACM336_03540 [Acidobacteriota bacterium]
MIHRLPVLLLAAAALHAEPIKLHPTNPHYLFNGKPTVLVTSAEHYGAVVNGDFDYIAYFDALKSYGLNYTRIYPGALFEPAGKFVTGNTLGVRPASLVLPWARGSEPGYLLGGNKFDLDRWNPAFFARLKDFVKQAAARGIVVEICFFNAQYSDTWPMSPLYYENNVQASGRCDFEDAQTLKHADLVRRQSEYVRKITEEVNAFDNVILEICDEPYLTGTPIELAGPWVGHFIEVIKTAEKPLANKHLIAQQIEGPMGGPCDFTGHPDVGVIVAQYVWESMAEQMGGMKALDYEYGHEKAIELNETDYYPLWYKGDKVGASRVEAWEFMVGGGASFNHLNGLFTVQNPAGKTRENDRILRAVGALKQFIESFDFIRMRADRGFVVNGIPLGTYSRGMSEPGRQYAWYIHHSTGRGGDYTVTPGEYSETFEFSLPPGTYRADWVEPATGSVLRTETFTHESGTRKLTAPAYTIDIALRIKRVDPRPRTEARR